MALIELSALAAPTRRLRRGVLPFIPLVVALIVLATPTSPAGRTCDAVWVTTGGHRVLTNVASLQVRQLMGQWQVITVEPAC